jgi:hypothetical protein
MRRACLALCIAAGLVVAAFAAASASAEAPEFGRCIKQVAVAKVFHGKYSDSKCTKAVSAEEEAKKGKYEWAPGPGANSQITAKFGVATIQTVHGKTMQCTGGRAAGEVLSGTNKEASLTITLTGCSSGRLPCTTTGKASGEITTNPLIEEAGWQEKAKKKTALELRAGPGNEGFLAHVVCVGLGVDARGAILVPIKNDKMTTTETLKYKSNNGVQKPDIWRVGEPGEESVFEETDWEHIAWEQTGTTTEEAVQYEEALELNAIV